MKLKRFNASVIFALLAMGSSHVMAQGVGLIDGDEPQNDKRVEVRTQVMVVNDGGQLTKSESRSPSEKVNLFTTSVGGVHFMSHNDAVKNAPYSAEAISETVQRLADGNTITSKNLMLNFRDSAGRTRTESRNAKGELNQVIISDPNGSVLMLNPMTKTANKIDAKFTVMPGKMAVGGVREINVETTRRPKDGGENIEVRAVVGEAKGGEKTVVIKRAGTTESDGGVGVSAAGGHAKAVTIDVRGPESGSAMGMIANGPDGAFMRLFSDSKWAAKKQTKSLGTKEIEGVKAEGKLTSFEIPAGEIGNAQAIVVSDEVWTSPELQVVLYSKHSDPRSGDRIYRLTNLKRDEVAASQFSVPSDYKVRDLSKEMKVIVKEKNEKAEQK